MECLEITNKAVLSPSFTQKCILAFYAIEMAGHETCWDNVLKCLH